MDEEAENDISYSWTVWRAVMLSLRAALQRDEETLQTWREVAGLMKPEAGAKSKGKDSDDESAASGKVRWGFRAIAIARARARARTLIISRLLLAS